MKKIGFIGVGVMGKSMVRNLMKAGYELSIYTRTKDKVQDIIEEGAVWRDTVAECVRDREAVITMVGYPEDVWEVYFGETGIIANARPGRKKTRFTICSGRKTVPGPQHRFMKCCWRESLKRGA